MRGYSRRLPSAIIRAIRGKQPIHFHRSTRRTQRNSRGIVHHGTHQKHGNKNQPHSSTIIALVLFFVCSVFCSFAAQRAPAAVTPAGPYVTARPSSRFRASSWFHRPSSFLSVSSCNNPFGLLPCELAEERSRSFSQEVTEETEGNHLSTPLRSRPARQSLSSSGGRLKRPINFGPMKIVTRWSFFRRKVST